jgi:hypothetical protein
MESDTFLAAALALLLNDVSDPGGQTNTRCSRPARRGARCGATPCWPSGAAGARSTSSSGPGGQVRCRGV